MLILPHLIMDVCNLKLVPYCKSYTLVHTLNFSTSSQVKRLSTLGSQYLVQMVFLSSGDQKILTHVAGKEYFVTQNQRELYHCEYLYFC